VRFPGDGRQGRLRLELRSGGTVLARGTARWRGRERVTLRLRLTTAGIRALPRGRRLTVVARHVPLRGKPATVTQRVLLR
jgi:hypothetical protein